MRTRFLFYTLLALTGGFLLVETQAFSQATAADLTLAGGIGAAALAIAALYHANRAGQKAFAALAFASALIGAWTVVASTGIFSDFATKWIGFGSGGAIVALALIALGLHEYRTERVVYALDNGAGARKTPVTTP